MQYIQFSKFIKLANITKCKNTGLFEEEDLDKIKKLIQDDVDEEEKEEKKNLMNFYYFYREDDTKYLLIKKYRPFEDDNLRNQFECTSKFNEFMAYI